VGSRLCVLDQDYPPIFSWRAGDQQFCPVNLPAGWTCTPPNNNPMSFPCSVLEPRHVRGVIRTVLLNQLSFILFPFLNGFFFFP